MWRAPPRRCGGPCCPVSPGWCWPTRWPRRSTPSPGWRRCPVIPIGWRASWACRRGAFRRRRSRHAGGHATTWPRRCDWSRRSTPMSRVPPRMRTTRWRRRCAGWPNSRPTAERSELVERQRQRRLLVGGLVLVDDTLGGGLVQLAAGGHQQHGGLVLVTRVEGLTEPADSRAKRRLHRLVAQSGALVGTDALFLRLDVG